MRLGRAWKEANGPERLLSWSKPALRGDPGDIGASRGLPKKGTVARQGICDSSQASWSAACGKNC